MLTYPNINPLALQLGPISIYWYGVMYLIGFLGALWYCIYRGAKKPKPWSAEEVTDLLFYVAVGVIFGGKLGDLIFYDFQEWMSHPLKVFYFWEPGRSFHGGLLGVLIAVYVFAKRHQRHFLEVTDLIAPSIPIGLGLGRLGNFINGELWGRVTDLPWGMVFPHAGNEPRHPSQLYEFFLEGIILFIILGWVERHTQKIGRVSGTFLLGYGLFRFIVEFVREPEAHQGFISFGWMTMGQWLSLPMIIFGFILLVYPKEPEPKPKENFSNSNKEAH